jgi:hypothetical protein
MRLLEEALLIFSGGQTGVDRAALDAAEACGISRGGWCPKGRLAEDGPIPATYPLRETRSARYPPRTERNVRESDATLVLHDGRPSCGTALTVRLAAKHSKPCLVVDLGRPQGTAEFLEWLSGNSVRVLNVAGPRESSAPGIYERARELLSNYLAAAKAAAEKKVRS